MYIVHLSCCAPRIKFKRHKNITTLTIGEKLGNLYKIKDDILGFLTNEFRIGRIQGKSAKK